MLLVGQVFGWEECKLNLLEFQKLLIRYMFVSMIESLVLPPIKQLRFQERQIFNFAENILNYSLV